MAACTLIHPFNSPFFLVYTEPCRKFPISLPPPLLVERGRVWNNGNKSVSSKQSLGGILPGVLMPRILTDAEIVRLLNERKVLPGNWAKRLAPKASAGQVHLRRNLCIGGENRSQFVIDVRQNLNSLLDFSIILSFVDDDNHKYILTRFNGRHPSQHTNKWEKKHRQPGAEFRNVFHIHKATERYQQEGYGIDGYAEPTQSYSSFDAALREFISSNGFVTGEDDDLQQRPLFPEGGPQI